jgi:hypothetical protein
MRNHSKSFETIQEPSESEWRARLKTLFFFVFPVALRHRHKHPAPFRHPVNVFCLFCSIVWQHFARHCRQLSSAYFYTPITWVNSI